MSEETNWDGVDRRGRQKWHMRKEISLGDLIAFATAVLAVIVAWTTLDKRISQLEVLAIVQDKRDTNQDADRKHDIGRIEAAIERVNDKLDRLLRERAK